MDLLPAGKLLARAVKVLAPEVRVVIGGGAVARPGLEAVLAAPYMDYAVLHDGEEALTGLLKALAAGNAEPALPGLCYQKTDGSFVIAEETVPVRQDRVQPADFTGLDLASYVTPRPVVPVLTARDRYWRRCTFCNHLFLMVGYRRRPEAFDLGAEVVADPGRQRRQHRAPVRRQPALAAVAHHPGLCPSYRAWGYHIEFK